MFPGNCDRFGHSVKCLVEKNETLTFSCAVGERPEVGT